MPDAPADARSDACARIVPYFASSRRGLALAGIGAVVWWALTTEPLIPALMQHLLDKPASSSGALPLWQVPLIVIGLFGLRGFAGFIAQYGAGLVGQPGDGGPAQRQCSSG